MDKNFNPYTGQGKRFISGYMCKRKNQNLKGYPVVYWDKTSGPRVEIQGLVLAMQHYTRLSFLFILTSTLPLGLVQNVNFVARLSIYYASLYTHDEKENKDFDWI